MDLFKFSTTGSDKTVLENGQAINGYLSAMWTERYREPGEFEIKAKLSSGLKDFLPEGTFISHIDTMEVMIVENHEINEEKDSDPDLRITGRTLDSFLENRIVGTTQARTTSTKDVYNLPTDYTWDQAVTLIADHAVTSPAGDRIGNVMAITNITGTSGTSESRDPTQNELLPQVIEILAVDDLGIKTVRRNHFAGHSYYGGGGGYTYLIVYRGVDQSNKVIFSWKAGDLEVADYLFSGKKFKTSAVIFGQYVQAVYDTAGYSNYDRRFMVVDGSDIDGHLDTAPTGAALTSIIGKLQSRGRQKLKSQTKVTISRTDVSNITKYQYRRDYNIGDLVTLDGNFGQIAKMRVVEFVEIDDENGESGHPTLSIPGV